MIQVQHHKYISGNGFITIDIVRNSIESCLQRTQASICKIAALRSHLASNTLTRSRPCALNICQNHQKRKQSSRWYDYKWKVVVRCPVSSHMPVGKMECKTKQKKKKKKRLSAVCFCLLVSIVRLSSPCVEWRTDWCKYKSNRIQFSYSPELAVVIDNVRREQWSERRSFSLFVWDDWTNVCTTNCFETSI